MPTLVPELFGIAGVKNLPKLEALRGGRDLIDNFMPTLVTFRNLDDPKSARVVQPDRFEKAFGADVHLKRVWIEFTSDPVTREISKELPWWSKAGRPTLEAYRAWREGNTAGPSIGPETLFRRGDNGYF